MHHGQDAFLAALSVAWLLAGAVVSALACVGYTAAWVAHGLAPWCRGWL